MPTGRGVGGPNAKGLCGPHQRAAARAWPHWVALRAVSGAPEPEAGIHFTYRVGGARIERRDNPDNGRSTHHSGVVGLQGAESFHSAFTVGSGHDVQAVQKFYGGVKLRASNNTFSGIV